MEGGVVDVNDVFRTPGIAGEDKCDVSNFGLSPFPLDLALETACVSITLIAEDSTTIGFG